MSVRVDLGECVQKVVDEALGFKVTITAPVTGLRGLGVSSGFASFFCSILRAMFASAVERAQGECKVQVRAGWDDKVIQLTFLDTGIPFVESGGSSAFEISEFRTMAIAYGGDLRWEAGGGPWQVMNLTLPIGSFPTLE